MPQTIECSGCRKQYRWKPELAGKRVKCKCGASFTAPLAEEADPEPAPQEDIYGIVDTQPATTKQASPPPLPVTYQSLPVAGTSAPAQRPVTTIHNAMRMPANARS